MSQDASGRLVAGRWTLHIPLRRAQHGLIWRATDPSGRQLAIEEVRFPAGPGPGGGGPAGLWDRVAAEARTAAAIDHPGLIRLEDVVVEDGVVYVVTELLDALTLDELIARHGPLPVRRVAQLGLELLDALEAAHAAGLPHLDLRPGCVLVTADGRARLAGIGLAALRAAPGADPGTTAFLAPEQVRGDPAGPPADLWSLGRSCSLRLRVRPLSPATAATSPAPPSSPPLPSPPSSPAPSPQPSTPSSPSPPAAAPPSPRPAASSNPSPATPAPRQPPGRPLGLGPGREWPNRCQGYRACRSRIARCRAPRRGKLAHRGIRRRPVSTAPGPGEVGGRPGRMAPGPSRVGGLPGPTGPGMGRGWRGTRWTRWCGGCC